MCVCGGGGGGGGAGAGPPPPHDVGRDGKLQNLLTPTGHLLWFRELGRQAERSSL